MLEKFVLNLMARWFALERLENQINQQKESLVRHEKHLSQLRSVLSDPLACNQCLDQASGQEDEDVQLGGKYSGSLLCQGGLLKDV